MSHRKTPEPSYYRWRKEYVDLKMDQAKRLKEFEKENGRLRQCCLGFDFGQADFEGGSLGKLLSPARRRACVDHVPSSGQHRCASRAPGPRLTEGDHRPASTDRHSAGV